MAVTARKFVCAVAAIPCAFLLVAMTQAGVDARGIPKAAPKTPLQQVAYVAEALTGGNAADAMTPFDKACANYDRIRDSFAALTSSFDLSNEIDATDSQEDKGAVKLTITWNLTLTDRETNYSENRSSEITVRLLHASGKWKIIEFAPIDIFTPQLHTPGKP